MNYELLTNCAGVTQTGRVIHMDWSQVNRVETIYRF
jgi:hypothetical protein